MDYSTEELTEKVINWVADKKAEHIVTIDVKDGNYTDKIVVCTGGSDLHIKAIADNVLDRCKEEKVLILSKEGLDAKVWVLIDFGSVILHVFKDELRKHYNLESLWKERNAEIKNIERVYS